MLIDTKYRVYTLWARRRAYRAYMLRVRILAYRSYTLLLPCCFDFSFSSLFAPSHTSFYWQLINWEFSSKRCLANGATKGELTLWPAIKSHNVRKFRLPSTIWAPVSVGGSVWVSGCECEYVMNSTVKLVALSQHAEHTLSLAVKNVCGSSRSCCRRTRCKINRQRHTETETETEDNETFTCIQDRRRCCCCCRCSCRCLHTKLFNLFDASRACVWTEQSGVRTPRHCW